MGEFELIKKYFTALSDVKATQGVVVGVGDDAAVVDVPDHQQLVSCVDSMVEGVHFFPNAGASSIAQRCIASNLSDLAAMGAEPRWCLLSLNLPSVNNKFRVSNQRCEREITAIDQQWLAAFSSQLAATLNRHDMQLIGGDTCAAQQLIISIQLLGVIEKNSAMLRSGAQPGDHIYATGFLGDAAAGLDVFKKYFLDLSRAAFSFDDYYEHMLRRDKIAWPLIRRFLFPQARVNIGRELKYHATACIDVSDGLCADVQHMAVQSQCDFYIMVDHIAQSPALQATVPAYQQRLHYMLNGGDDYELVFCAPANRHEAISALAKQHQLPVTRIGYTQAYREDRKGQVICLDKQQKKIDVPRGGYQHNFNY